MRKNAGILILLASLLMIGSTDGQMLIVDQTPDSVPDGFLTGGSFSSLTNAGPNSGSSTIGDSFELTQPTEITGGACYGNSGGRTGSFGVGDELQFGVLAGNSVGLPTPTAVINETCVVDLYDNIGSTLVPGISRYHVTLKTPVVLQPGTYIFTLPGTDTDPQVAIGFGLEDGVIFAGSNSNIDLEFGPLSTGFDMYFQLEGNPMQITSLLGDINIDGVIDLLDVQPFVDLILNGGFQAEADINQDGIVDLLDIAGFVTLILGG